MEVLRFKTQNDLYEWFKNNHLNQKEVFVEIKKVDPKKNPGIVTYVEAVEVALCFGWIDSVFRNIDGKFVSRFSPRTNKSPWTELNKERVRRLIRLGLMTDFGLAKCPSLNEKFIEPERVIDELKKNKEAYDFFLSTPKLYQRIRLYNVNFYYSKSEKLYESALNNLIKNCSNKKLYGEWNDYGRLLNL